jgi:formylglycine-generating enzyme required for sulfatase activity
MVYYYVVITNTNNSATDAKTAAVTSNAAAITVTGGGTDPVTPQADMVRLSGGTITGSGSGGVFINNRTVNLSAFSIAKYETTYELWYAVKKWAADNNKGYTFANAGREGMTEPMGLLPHQGQRLNR